MNIEFSNNEDKKILEKIAELEKDLEILPNEKVRNGQQYYFSFMSDEEIENIFIIFGLPDYIKQIEYLKECESKTFLLTKKAINSSPNKNELLKMKEDCLKVLDRIYRKSKKVNNKLVFLKKLDELVMSTFAVSEKFIDELMQMIESLDLNVEEKDYYITKIKVINNQKLDDEKDIPKKLDEAFKELKISNNDETMVEIFEKNIDALSKEMNKRKRKSKTTGTLAFFINRYFNPISEYYLGDENKFLSECNLSEFGETIESTIENIKKEGLNLTTFSYFVAVILEKIKINDKPEYRAILESIHVKFMVYFEKKKQFDEIKRYMNDIPKKATELFFYELDNLRNLYRELEREFKHFDIKNLAKFEKLVDDINNITLDINLKLSISYVNNEVVNNFGYNLKGFVLFDCNSKGQTYVEGDMLGKDNLVDHTAVQRTPKYGKDMSKLIANFILRGTEFITDDMDSGYDKEKLCNEIRGYDNKGDVDFKKTTGIYRLRPDHNSNARIAERKIVISKDTKLYSQVIESIKKFYPSFSYSKNDDLVLFDICGAAVKAADWDLYKIVLKRKNDNELNILKLFAKNGIYMNRNGKVDFEVKDEFTDDEINNFEEFINITMTAMNKLAKNNSNFNFDYSFDVTKNIFKKI